jgi:hypothetical protein
LKWAEKGEAEYVVEVEVGEEGGGAQGGPEGSRLVEQHITEGTHSRTHIDDERIVPVNFDQEA